MRTKTKIVVIKLKDILFYATVVFLCIIVLFMLYILFQPKAVSTNSTIDVQAESDSLLSSACPNTVIETKSCRK